MPEPPRVVTLSRQDALHTKIHGQSFASMELDDIQDRIAALLGDLAALTRTLSELRRRYGPRTLIEQLDDRELERVLNVMHLLVSPAQTVRVE